MAQTTTTTDPATFIESESKLYLDELKKAIGGLKGQDLSTIMGPDFVAGLSDLQKEAISKAGGFVEDGDLVINLTAMPITAKGMVNTLRVSQI